MNNPNLIPETRVNKNGVPVVKHVRPQHQAINAKNVPAPVTPDMHIERMFAIFKPLLPDYGGSPKEYLDAFKIIGRGNPSLLTDVMRSYLAGSEEERAVWRNAIYADAEYDYELEKHYRRMIEVIPMSVHMYPATPPGIRYSRIRDRAREAEYRVKCDPGYENYVQVKAEVILAETRTTSIPTFERQDRIDYMSENMEALYPFLPQLIEREDTSVELMRGLLENASPSLSEGVL